VNSDGVVLLNVVNADGSLQPRGVVSISMDDILTKYKIATTAIELDDRAPFASAPELPADALATIAFSVMYCKREDFNESGMCRVQVRPTKSVIALRSWAAGVTVAMPVTTLKNLKVIDAVSKDDGADKFVIEVTDANGVTTQFAMGQPHSKTHSSIAFLFKTSDKEEDANLTVAGLVENDVTVWCTGGQKYTVKLPVVKASTDIAVDAEMVLYIPAVQKGERKRKAKEIEVDYEAGGNAKSDKKVKKDKAAKKAKAS